MDGKLREADSILKEEKRGRWDLIEVDEKLREALRIRWEADRSR